MGIPLMAVGGSLVVGEGLSSDGVISPSCGVLPSSCGVPMPARGETTPLGGTGIFRSSGEDGMISGGRPGIGIRFASLL